MKYITKLGTSLAFALGVLCASASPSQATVVVDPTLGGSYGFSWSGGLGPIDDIDGTGMTDWSMTVATGSVLSLVAATDSFVIGDEFALIFDGGVIAWDAITSPGGFFSGAMTDLFLSAGLHTFTLSLTALAPAPLGGPFLTGTAFMDFGTASPSSVVPLPAALPLGLAGLGMLGFVGWRRRRRTTA